MADEKNAPEDDPAADAIQGADAQRTEDESVRRRVEQGFNILLGDPDEDDESDSKVKDKRARKGNEKGGRFSSAPSKSGGGKRGPRISFFQHELNDKGHLVVTVFCSDGVSILDGNVVFLLQGKKDGTAEEIGDDGYCRHTFRKLPTDVDEVFVRAQLEGTGVYADTTIDITEAESHGQGTRSVKGEPVRLHVRRIPLDDQGRWRITGTVRGKDRFLAGFPVTVSHGPGYDLTASANGGFQKDLTVTKDCRVPVSATSELTVDVELLGPDVPEVAAHAARQGWWPRWNNRVFILVTLLLLWVTLWAGVDLYKKFFSPTPATAAYQQGGDQQGESSAAARRRKYSQGPQQEESQQSEGRSRRTPSPEQQAQTPPQPTGPTTFLEEFASLWTAGALGRHDPNAWFRQIYFVFYFLVWAFIWIPACFYDEARGVFKGARRKVERQVRGFTAKRDSDDYVAEIKKDETGGTKVVFLVNGEERSTTAPSKERKTAISRTELFKNMFKVEVLSDVIIKLVSTAFRAIFRV